MVHRIGIGIVTGILMTVVLVTGCKNDNGNTPSPSPAPAPSAPQGMGMQHKFSMAYVITPHGKADV